jgi:hypothetical protein
MIRASGVLFGGEKRVFIAIEGKLPDFRLRPGERRFDRDRNRPVKGERRGAGKGGRDWARCEQTDKRPSNRIPHR